MVAAAAVSIVVASLMSIFEPLFLGVGVVVAATVFIN